MPLLISVVPSIGSTATSTSGPGAVAHGLAVVEHRRVVLLALADHHDAAHRYRIDQHAHRVDGGAVAALLVAPADPPAGGHRGRLGDADQVERQVAVEILRLAGGTGHRPILADRRLERSFGWTRTSCMRLPACDRPGANPKMGTVTSSPRPDESGRHAPRRPDSTDPDLAPLRR
jgi:hypothetical protein